MSVDSAVLEERFDKKLDKVVAVLDQVKETVNRKSEEVTTQFGDFRGELKSLNDRLVTLLEYAQRNEDRLIVEIRDLREGQSDHRYRLVAVENEVKKIANIEAKLSEHKDAISRFVPRDKLDEKFTAINQTLGGAVNQNRITASIFDKYIRPMILAMIFFAGGMLWDNVRKPATIAMTNSPTINTPSR